MNMIRHLKGKNWGMNTKLLLITYKALIRSLLEYAPPAIITMSDAAIKEVETIQSKAVRSITRWPPHLTNKAMLEAHKLETIKGRAEKLMDNYLQKANNSNPLIRSTIRTYKIAPQLNEGLFCKLKKPRTTPLGVSKCFPETFKAPSILK